MPRHPSKRDPSEDAAAVVRRSTGVPDELPSDLEAAWADWSSRIKDADERMRTLLRAAFEAGAATASRAAAALTLGRLGAKKGGDARAAKLSKSRRVEIAKKAAKKRWG